jgi:cell division protein FtsW
MARMPDNVLLVPLRQNAGGRGLLIATLVLLALGVVMVYSAMISVADPGPWYSRSDVRHTIFATMAAILLMLGWRLDYRILDRGDGAVPKVAMWLLIVSLVCGVLVFVPGVGYSKAGYARWIRLGPPHLKVGFQPSELIKITLVIYLATWLARPATDVRRIRTFLVALAWTGLAVGVVFTQDLGTGAVIGLSACATMLIAGVPLLYFFPLLPLGAALAWVAIQLGPHRWSRIAVLQDIWGSDLAAAYQPRQSLLAILTGGCWGKGLGRGELQLGYLPEDSTDFIFAAFCEEWGVIGAVLLIGLLLVWLGRVWQISLEASDRLGQVLAGSLGFLIISQALMHVGVDTVVLPPTGMSLPFVSAGGTSLVLLAGATAIIVSISARKAVKDPLL